MINTSATPRRLLALSLASLLAAFALTAAVSRSNSVPDELAGIEREGDIPLPVAC